MEPICRFSEDIVEFATRKNNNGITNFDLIMQQKMLSLSERMAFRQNRGEKPDFARWNELRKDYHDWLMAIVFENDNEIERLAELHIKQEDGYA